MYGGEIEGGFSMDTKSGRGGGCIRVTASAIMRMKGGSITGGTAEIDGGCIRVGGTLNYTGGTISGGTVVSGVGANVFVAKDGVLNIGKDLTLEGVEYGS